MIGTFQHLESSGHWKIPMSGRRRGFTLLELLAVMAILAILAGLGAGGYQLARRSAKEGQAKAEIEQLRTALEEYRVEYGRYPEQFSAGNFSSIAEISTLSDLTDTMVLNDPWGRAYQYQSTNRFLYRIWSEGENAESDADNIDPSLTGY
ncbi:type II secretion system protein GspG [Pontiellaceae bacterium B1224]|nr:type II secretion system protein GspG [Pontiellaceae bacterium B1224]